MNLIYEINTRVWLRQLSAKYNRNITLGNIPLVEYQRLKKIGFGVVWLMGVWRQSTKGREIAQQHEGLRQEFLHALPDLSKDDIVCSPYSIANYEPDQSLGGVEGIKAFKERLHKQGMKLILDFVPNHLALDHPWVSAHPEYFINGTVLDMQNDAGTYFLTKNRVVLAHGKDPYYPAWTDVAQLNYFNPQTRKAMLDELVKIAALCDGVRCDMAMLILKQIQKQVWGDRVHGGNTISEPHSEFWQEAIATVKKAVPDFTFIAEVYWGMEQELVRLGFDFVYDKNFYDALKIVDLDGLRHNLNDSGELANKRLRFIENHDENRAAAVFGKDRSKAACLLMLLASGAHLIHQGQMEGFTIKLPVQLIRIPKEDASRELEIFYENLLLHLKIISQTKSPWVWQEPSPAWDGNPTFRNFFVFSHAKSYLAVINYSPVQSQCYVRLGLGELKATKVLLKDLLGSEKYTRSQAEICSPGFYVDIPAFGFHLFRITEA